MGREWGRTGATPFLPRPPKAWYDGDSKLYKTDTRLYAPELGRFTQVDPARAAENWFVYSGSDPVNKMDPTGLDWEWQSSGVLAAGGEWKYVDGTDPFVPFPQFRPGDVGGVDYVGSEEYRSIRDSYSGAVLQVQAGGLAEEDPFATLVVGGNGGFPSNFANQTEPFSPSPYLLEIAASHPEIARSIAGSVIATGSSDLRLLSIGNAAFANAAQQGVGLEGSFEMVDNFWAHQDWLSEQARAS